MLGDLVELWIRHVNCGVARVIQLRTGGTIRTVTNTLALAVNTAASAGGRAIGTAWDVAFLRVRPAIPGRFRCLGRLRGHPLRRWPSRTVLCLALARGMVVVLSVLCVSSSLGLRDDGRRWIWSGFYDGDARAIDVCTWSRISAAHGGGGVTGIPGVAMKVTLDGLV